MKQSWLVLAIFLCALFMLVTFGAHVGAWDTFDEATIHQLQAAAPKSFDLPFSFLSLIGSFEVTFVLLALVLFVFFRPPYRFLLLALFLLAVGIEVVGKYVIAQPGPPHELNRYVRLVPLLPTGNVYTPFSFPSGHAARSAFITVLLAAWIESRPRPRTVQFVLWFILLLAEGIMVTSRVVLGEHWSSDVIGGTLIGAALALPAFSRGHVPQSDALVLDQAERQL